MQITSATGTEYRCYSRAFLLFSILSICVGIFVFVNGIINCFDHGNVSDITKNQKCYDCGIVGSSRTCPTMCSGSGSNYVQDPSNLYPINKRQYMCGGMNFWNLNQDELDSGFFYRVHEIIRTLDYDFPPSSSYEKMDFVDAFPFLMALAIVCGSIWIASGIIGIIAYIKYNRTLIGLATFVCQISYLTYIVLFCFIWTKVLYISNDCREYLLLGTEGNYNSFQGHSTRSSLNFLIYSIIAFVIECFAILVGIQFYLIFVQVELIPQEYSLRKVVIPPGYSGNTLHLPDSNSSQRIIMSPSKSNYLIPSNSNITQEFVNIP